MCAVLREKTAPAPAANLRDALLETATGLFRQQGFIATTVDEICAQAGATKGAFFHHFKSKEALAEECLARWKQSFGSMIAGSPGVAAADPVDRVLAFFDFFIHVFSDPKQLKSCLAGTTVQEVSETHPRLREAANDCFVALKGHLQSLLDEACRSRRLKRDTDSLASLWIATMQGALVLCKASRDDSVVPASLRHVRAYIASQLEVKPPAPRRAAKR
ncbi:MAG: TetR/AcrR family transcriptional regulator [Pirellulales bacterium]